MQLNGLTGSSAALVIACMFDETGKQQHMVVLPDKEQAAYFYNDLESIYDDITLYCKIIAPPAVQPVEKRWPDIEVIITLKK